MKFMKEYTTPASATVTGTHATVTGTHSLASRPTRKAPDAFSMKTMISVLAELQLKGLPRGAALEEGAHAGRTRNSMNSSTERCPRKSSPDGTPPSSSSRS